MSAAKDHPHVSIVVPVYNEEANLPLLFTRLYATLDRLDCSWECVFVDDGSKDRSAALLRAQYQARPQHTGSSYSGAISASTPPSWPASRRPPAM
jgi:glycosyltransferase involved in cell wall biosynthesis